MTETRRSRTVSRRIAGLVLLYGALLAVATITLGVFVIAFVASLKEDALSNPTELRIAQLDPTNWWRAQKLGSEGGDDPWLGGLKSGAEMTFTVTYAAVDGETMVEPSVRVPHERVTAIDGSSYTFGAHHFRVTTPELIDTGSNVSFVETSGTKRTPRVGDSKTWRFVVTYNNPETDAAGLPLDILVRKGQVLIDSNLPPNRIERRGRIASWDNLTPGVLGFVFGNYVRVLEDARSTSSGRSLFLSWTFNSAYIAVLKVLLTLIIACCGGYALARFRFPGSRIIFFTMLLSMMVPGQVLFISNYLVFRTLGLMNTPWAVITAIVASGQVLIMKQFFEGIPREVEEAAIVDGAGPLRTMWHIFLPMSKPAIASVVILGFQGAWNDFFWPLVVLTSPSEAYTLPVGLLSMRNAYGEAGDWGLILAGSFLSTIPVLIIFIFFQRYFVENDSSSAVKG